MWSDLLKGYMRLLLHLCHVVLNLIKNRFSPLSPLDLYDTSLNISVLHLQEMFPLQPFKQCVKAPSSWQKM